MVLITNTLSVTCCAWVMPKQANNKVNKNNFILIYTIDYAFFKPYLKLNVSKLY